MKSKSKISSAASKTKFLSVEKLTTKTKAPPINKAQTHKAQTPRAQTQRRTITQKAELARAQTLEDLVREKIRHYLQESVGREAAVLADTDPEELHQMRVALRRLRTALVVFEPVLNRPPNVTDRQLAKIAKTLGKVRDIDVLRQGLKKHLKHSDLLPEELEAIENLRKKLKNQRKPAMRDVRDLLSSKTYRRTHAAIHQWLQNLTHNRASAF